MAASKRFYRRVIITGFIAGILDLAGAVISTMLVNNRFPKKILETIAGGAFGKESIGGGTPMKLWGLLFHFLIAISFTFVYFFAYQKIKLLRKNIFLSALLYGLFVWAIMNMVVLPLSAYHSPVIPQNYIAAARAAFVLIVCIGLPIAISARSYYSRNNLQV
jgi:phosphoglycerol transferase MdoB-like AlkP superfamily enzyme